MFYKSTQYEFFGFVDYILKMRPARVKQHNNMRLAWFTDIWTGQNNTFAKEKRVRRYIRMGIQRFLPNWYVLKP